MPELTPRVHHHWHHFEPIPDDLRTYHSPVLTQLRDLLERRKEELTQAVRDRIHRLFAIETGVIEGIYNLSKGVTESLIESGIKASLIPSGENLKKTPELVAEIINDHIEALDGLFSFVKSARELSTSYIKELHQLTTRHQQTATAHDLDGNLIEIPLLRGDWKKRPNNPTRPDGAVHEYCPPEHVASEMDRLVDLYRTYQDQGISPEVLAAWFHHRFTQIHPFQDGNGRVVRFLASLVLIKHNLPPLVVRREQRAQYIDALEAADKGDIGAFVAFVVECEELTIREALSDIRDARLTTVLEGAKRLASGARPDLWHKARALRDQCTRRLMALCEKIREEARDRGAPVDAATGEGEGDAVPYRDGMRILADAAGVMVLPPSWDFGAYVWARSLVTVYLIIGALGAREKGRAGVWLGAVFHSGDPWFQYQEGGSLLGSLFIRENEETAAAMARLERWLPQIEADFLSEWARIQSG
ncbi:MAG: Fic family protein [Planctomycetes bacterium]|nr:Fic family protein [Planctomycetota bacterium]